MSEISALTGQALLLSQISRKLEQKTAICGLLEGPPGCGKSWLLEQLLKNWSAEGRSGVLVSGDRSFSERSYATWLSGISLIESSADSSRLIKRAASESGKLVPATGSLLTFLLDVLLHSKERRQRTQTLHLSDQEHEIMFRLQHLAGRRRLLLIVDDLQSWDPESIRLLLMVLSPRLAAVYPFLKNMHVMAAVSRGWKPKHDDIWQQLFRLFRKNEWHLECVSEEKLPELLSAFGLHIHISEEQKALLYTISGGHLELIRQLAEYYNLHPNKHWNALSLPTTPALDMYEMLQQFVKERLEHLGAEGQRTLDTLSIASVIGRSFSCPELSCILGTSREKLADILAAAEQLRLLKRENEIISFSHEALRESFLKASAARAPENHTSFAKCLAVLRPSDYLTRAEHLLLGGQEDLASQVYFVALLRKIRECEPVMNDFRERVYTMMSRFGYGSVCSAMLQAYALFSRKHYAKAATLLGGIEFMYPEMLLAERDYLFALCLLKNFSSKDNVKTVQLLKGWDGLMDQEPDLWCRIQMTLLVAQSRANDVISAKHIERSVGRYYSRIRRSDPSADVAINILRRKSANLYGAEVATERCRLAVLHFQPAGEATTSRNPAQYYMALCNLAGNLLVIGEFEEAREKAQLACTFWDACKSAEIPRLEVSINNLVVSGYLSGALNARSAVAAMEQIQSSLSEAPDKYILMNNYVILEALSGDLGGALRHARSLIREFRASPSDDAYYSYWISVNLAALLHLNGQTERGLEMSRRLSLPDIPEPDRQFLIVRQQLQEEAFSAIKPGDVEGWESFLHEKHPDVLGPPWRFYGRGFLFSDIQFWSES